MVAVADFNGDGKGDLVTADNNSNAVSVLLGNGNGTFQAKQSFGTGNVPYGAVAADFNGDGVKDLVTADQGGNTVSVLLGNGTTTTTTTSTTTITTTSTTTIKTTTTTTTTTTTVDGLPRITGLSLATQANALLAQGQINGYLDCVNHVSGTIGAGLSRFQIAAETSQSIADLSTAAKVRITDADVATDVAALVRDQIIQQAATAMLAQANLQPALALTLLQG